MENKPIRPRCFDFAMDFLGEPQAAEIIKYIEALESNAMNDTTKGQYDTEPVPNDGFDDDGRDIRLGCAILIASALFELAIIGWLLWLFT